MSTIVKEVIVHWFGGGIAQSRWSPQSLIDALDDAGYEIVPKEQA